MQDEFSYFGGASSDFEGQGNASDDLYSSYSSAPGTENGSGMYGYTEESYGYYNGYGSGYGQQNGDYGYSYEQEQSYSGGLMTVPSAQIAADYGQLQQLDSYDMGLPYPQSGESAPGSAASMPQISAGQGYFSILPGENIGQEAAYAYSALSAAQDNLSLMEMTGSLSARKSREQRQARDLANDLSQLDHISSDSEVIPEIDAMLPQIAHRSIGARMSIAMTAVNRMVHGMRRNRKAALITLGALAATVLILVGGSFAGLFDASVTYVKANEVYFDGKVVGTVKDSAEMQTVVDGIYSELSEEYGMTVLEDQLLEMRETRVDRRYICAASDVGSQIRQNIDARVNAAVIYIDGMAAVALKDETAANWVLNEMQAPFADGASDGSVGFIEDVEIRQEDVSCDLLYEKKDAYNLVALGIDAHDAGDQYQAEEGDTVEIIAAANGLTVDELTALNEGLSDENLSAGDSVVIAKNNPLLNVGYKEIVTVQENIPYETQYTKDSSLYIGQSRTVTEGVYGLKNVTVEIRYINNQEVSRSVLGEEVISDPVTRVVAQGSANLPSISGGVSSYGFIVPCDGHLTSPFGPRWGSFHYGIDLANVRGTPIYAAKAGTVISSGWSGNYGYQVTIDHGDGYQTRYAHCSTLIATVGQHVSQGEAIGLMGSTGYSTGNHLHFEVIVNGTRMNPLNYL